MKILIRLFQIIRLIVMIPIIFILLLAGIIEWIIKGSFKLNKWIEDDLFETLFKPFDNA